MFLECLGKFEGEFGEEEIPHPHFIETRTIKNIYIYEEDGSYAVIAAAFDGQNVNEYVIESDFSSEKAARDYIGELIYEFDSMSPVSYTK